MKFLPSAFSFLALFAASASGDDCNGDREIVKTQLDFMNSELAVNTLHLVGGQLRYTDVGFHHNDKPLDIIVTVTSGSYTDIAETWADRTANEGAAKNKTWDENLNGKVYIRGEPSAFANVNLQTVQGKPESGRGNFRMCIVDQATDEEVSLEQFSMTVYDADERGEDSNKAEALKERMFVDMDEVLFYKLDPNTEIELRCEDDGATVVNGECDVGRTIFHSSTAGKGSDNPTDPNALDATQLARSIRFTFSDRACWEFTYDHYCPTEQNGGTKPCKGYTGGNFLFAGDSASLESEGECITKAPTSEPTQAPVVATDSPTVATASPTVATASPTVATASPTEATASPTVATASPTEATASPTVATASPTAATASPTVATASPTVSTASPTVSTASPTVSTAAPSIPIVKTEPPVARTESPTAASASPTAATGSPTAATDSPTVATSSPTVATAAPTVATSSPTVSPTAATESPTMESAHPTTAKPTESPTVATAAPTVATGSPTVATAAPTVATGSPTAATAAPTVATASPTAATAAPTLATGAETPAPTPEGTPIGNQTGEPTAATAAPTFATGAVTPAPTPAGTPIGNQTGEPTAATAAPTFATGAVTPAPTPAGTPIGGETGEPTAATAAPTFATGAVTPAPTPAGTPIGDETGEPTAATAAPTVATGTPTAATAAPTAATAAPTVATGAPTAATASPTAATGQPSLPPAPCPEDVVLIKTVGTTPIELHQAVQVLRQDTSTVTVRLYNSWTSSADVVQSIFYQYKNNYDNKCYEVQDVVGGDTYEDVTIQCMVSKPYAELEIWIEDDVLLSVGGDNAEIPKCCKQPDATSSPAVKYTMVIQCETVCVEAQERRGLRGSVV